MSAVLLTPPYIELRDANGVPLAGGKIYTYAAGTTTPKQTFTDESALIPAQNPIILDSAGRASVWILGSYKIVVMDAEDNIIRVTDNVTSFNTIADENDAFFETFSGDGSQTTFTFTEDLGTDERTVMVFVDNGSSEYQTNGNFSSDTAWTKGAGWTISGGVANASGAISTAISQSANPSIVQGQLYSVTYTVTRTAGSITASIGGTAGTARSAAGTYTEVIAAGSSQLIAFTGAGFTGTITNVRVRSATSSGFQIQNPSQYTLNGTSITFAIAPASGTNNIQVWAPSLLVGSASAAAAMAEDFADQAGVFANQAEVARDAAQAAQAAAEQARDDAHDEADLAESWAIGNIVDRPEGSSKYWAELAATYAPYQNNLTATTDPTPADDSTQGYSVGSFWINNTGNVNAFICRDNSPGAALWLKITIYNAIDVLFNSVGLSMSPANVQAAIVELSKRVDGDYQNYSIALSGNFNGIDTAEVDGASAGFTNAPPTSETNLRGFVKNNRIDGGIILQVYTSYNSATQGITWTRQYNGTVWSAWKLSSQSAGLPSDDFSNISAPTTGNTIVMPHDGWLCFAKGSAVASEYIVLINNTKPGLGCVSQLNLVSNSLRAIIPVRKGDVVLYLYTASGSTNVSRLYRSINGEN